MARHTRPGDAVSAVGRPPPGAPLSEHTAWHRRRHEEHARAEEQSRSGLARPKRRSFRPLPPGELAPTIKRHNDERARADAEAEANRNAALEILTACDHLAKCVRDGVAIDPSVVDMFQEAIREYLNASGALGIGRARKGESIDAMHDAIASLLKSLGR
jgi:hypothetical protein